MKNKSFDIRQEKRKYIRLNTIFPVEFQVIDREDRKPLSDIYEGFTRNVGKGGMGIFVKTKKEANIFNFVPHETKLRVIINIPLDKEPIESFATVEWIEKQSDPILDTYYFGISYDFINELEYEKIESYVRWLRLKPWLIGFTIGILSVAMIVTLVVLFNVNQRRIESEKELTESIFESRRAFKARQRAEREKVDIETQLEEMQQKKLAMQAVLEKLVKSQRKLEDLSKVSEEDRRELQARLDELAAEKASLEERIEQVQSEAEEGQIETEGAPEDKSKTTGASKWRLAAEETNYNRFRELILNEKIHSLGAYLSAHRSSIYHAASLFALAELRYKYGERSLAAVSYNQVIELYPRSKYALYASHRLDQLNKNYNYEQFTLKYLCDEYNLPELFDYRNIEPYVK